MTVLSMTGFARSEGALGRYRWAWELRSVNGKGLDMRLRLPNGLETMENEVRRLLQAGLTRGNIQISLNLSQTEPRVEAVLNRDALDAVLSLKGTLGPDVLDPAPLTLDALLAMRGVVEFKEAEETAETLQARDAAILSSLKEAVDALCAMREHEGSALKDVLLGQVAQIGDLTATIEADPSRSPEEIAKRLKAQVGALMEGGYNLDRERLHMEAALIATKADLREEIDRLKAHVSAARELLAKGGPIGRKLDFLAQEFNRETNTVCSKSTSVAVTNAGIELKVVIDQFREQLQNLE
ncbi:YicC/YloC family endoribonuclease [Rhizobium halophytocola]|uniref:Uncharacterized protein (TIGR00255 family) n=1 Tax=Rhizobium halophytocola TaxID=735519 RepID=A0ABS4DYJ0_9HYPH|nr:YicC/YloC family endoribonuclease [Rhizobium halophytocola]MBP1850752.1 uncharacterized protein (TIGR00255 family) [Rhizobium halophytocola]